MEPAPPPHDGAGELRDSAYRTIFESLTVPLLVVGPDGTIRSAGGSVARDFGFTPEEAVGRNIVDFIPPEEVGRALASMGDLLQHEDIGLGVPTPFPIVRADGTHTWTAVGAVPLLDDPDIAGYAFYHLPWDAQLHFDDALGALLAGEPLPVVLGELARSIVASLEVVGAVVHHGFDGERFEAAAGAGAPDALLALDVGPWVEAAAVGERRCVDVADLPAPLRSASCDAGLAGCWSIPLPSSDDLDPAVLTIWRDRPGPPVTAHEFVLTRCLRYVQLVLVRWTEHQQLAHLATHDALTGAANRLLFNRHLDRSLETGEGVAVLFCDLDGFKEINDTHGHGVGDAVLVEVADRLRAALGPGDELARIGGDEFTVLVHGPADAAVTVAIAERLVDAMRVPFTLGELDLAIGLSVGIAVAHPGVTADAMLSRADAALYRAKRDGGGCVRLSPGAEPPAPS